MGGFNEIDEGILAGEKIEDEDIDAAAGINPLKVEKRVVRMEAPLANAVFTGTSVAIASLTIYPYVLLPNANSGSFVVTTTAPRGEIVAGEKLRVKILWTSNTTSGNLRLVVDVKPAIAGVSSLSSALQRAIISPAPSVAKYAVEAILEFPPSIFAPNQIIGVQVARDPSNSLDTLAGDIFILAVVLEINGRC